MVEIAADERVVPLSASQGPSEGRVNLRHLISFDVSDIAMIGVCTAPELQIGDCRCFHLLLGVLVGSGHDSGPQSFDPES